MLFSEVLLIFALFVSLFRFLDFYYFNVSSFLHGDFISPFTWEVAPSWIENEWEFLTQ